MQRKDIDYKDALSLLLPKVIFDYFDLKDYSVMSPYYVFCLEVKNTIPNEYSSPSARFSGLLS